MDTTPAGTNNNPNQWLEMGEGHGLSKIITPIKDGIFKKEDAIKALADELDGTGKDIRELLEMMNKLKESDGPLELEENSPEMKLFKQILEKLEKQGHHVDISDFCSVKEVGGKKVYVFSEEQKASLTAKLDGMLSATEHTKQEQIAELQRATSEGRDLYNLLSNLIKIYYDTMKTIISDTGV